MSFKSSLTFQMVIATTLAILIGLFFGDSCAIFAAPATAYIMILKITTIPYLIVAIMHGVGQLTSTQAKQILKKGIYFMCMAWTINILMVYLAAFLFPKVKSSHYVGNFLHPTPSINFAELLIPENIFYSLSNNIVPSVVLFSLLIGMALMLMKEKKTPILSFLDTILEALTRITYWISRITPIGTFLIIANQVGTIQLTTVKQISTYIIIYILVTCIVTFWIFPRLVSMLTSIPAWQWLKDLFPILLLAYTTNAVIICLPYIISLIEKKLKEVDPGDEKAQTPIQGTVSIVFNLPLSSLFIAAFVFFAAIFYNTPLGFSHQVQLFLTSFLTALGAIGIGSWINSLSFLLDSLGMTLEAIDLFLLTLPFTAGFQSIVAAMEVASLSLLIILACRHKITLRFSKILTTSFLTVIPIFLLTVFLKTTNPFPQICNLTKSIYEMRIASPVKAAIYPFRFSSSPSSDDLFNKILATKVLRVGYNINATPFCFQNNFNEIVGYDIAFAYKLAEDLGCNLELVPMNYGKVGEELASGIYDIAMSALSISEERLLNILFTEPYLSSKILFIAKSNYRKAFSSIETIQKDPSLKIAVLKGSSFEALAHKLFPTKEIISLEHYDLFLQQDAKTIFLLEEQEGLSWVVRHGQYSLIIPDPSIGIDSLSYGIRLGEERFQDYLNQWLLLKKNEGFMQEQYDTWILGKTALHEPKEPRWSIVRDVFHWKKS